MPDLLASIAPEPPVLPSPEPTVPASPAPRTARRAAKDRRAPGPAGDADPRGTEQRDPITVTSNPTRRRITPQTPEPTSSSGATARRAPALLAVILLVVAAVLVDRRVAPPEAVVSAALLAATVPSALPADALSSTWYCAAGSATGSTAEPATGSQGSATSTSTTSTSTTTTNPTGGTTSGTVPAGAASTAPPVVAEQTLIIANAGDTAQKARVTVYPNEGDPVTRAVDLPAGSRTDVKVSDIVKATSAAALVETDGGLVAVDHHLEGPTGQSVASCSSTASPTWYFATGTTRLGAREIFSVFNPFAQPVVVDFTFQVRDEGDRQSSRRPRGLQGLVVPPGRFTSVDIGADVDVRDQIATKIEARGDVGRVIVDRVQVDDGTKGRPTQLSVAAGAPALMPGWVFADGRRWSGTETTFVVYNPGTQPVKAALAVRVDGSSEDVEPFTVQVLPGEYAEMLLDTDNRIPQQSAYWAAVQTESGEPIVVERVVRPAAAGASTTSTTTSGPAGSTSSSDTPNADSSTIDPATKNNPVFQIESATTTFTLGLPVTAQRWIVPVGGSDRIAQGVVAVTNVSSRPVTLSVVAIADGQRTPLGAFAGVTLAAGRRTTVNLDDTVPGERTHRLLLVEANGPIAVDQALFSDQPKRSTSQLAAIPLRDSLALAPRDLVDRASTAPTIGGTAVAGVPGTDAGTGSTLEPSASNPAAASSSSSSSAAATTTTASTPAAVTTTAAAASSGGGND